MLLSRPCNVSSVCQVDHQNATDISLAIAKAFAVFPRLAVETEEAMKAEEKLTRPLAQTLTKLVPQLHIDPRAQTKLKGGAEMMSSRAPTPAESESVYEVEAQGGAAYHKKLKTDVAKGATEGSTESSTESSTASSTYSSTESTMEDPVVIRVADEVDQLIEGTARFYGYIASMWERVHHTVDVTIGTVTV